MFSQQVKAENAIITTDNVNIRSGPGTEFEPIGQANTNEEYHIKSTQGNWVEIEFENQTGWIISDYISILENDPEINENTDKTITIRYDNTQLRSGPSTKFEIISFAESGDTFDVVSEAGDWYEITNDEVTGYVLKQLIDPIDQYGGLRFDFTDKTIVIDAGHGGHDVGAIGASGSYEKDIASVTAKELEKKLTSLGANVLLTRPEDEFISLKSRATYSNVLDTDAFISIHYNSFPEQPNVTGIETYYYHEQNKELAHYIQQEIIKETNARDRGTSVGDYYVIRQNFQPSVLLELGFISNKGVEQLLHTNTYQQQLVTGIVNGLGIYFSNY